MATRIRVMKWFDRILSIFVIISFFVVFWLFSHWAYQEEEEDLKLYEEQVCLGHWPNYLDRRINCFKEDKPLDNE